jgi:type IV secretion system protein VirB6
MAANSTSTAFAAMETKLLQPILEYVDTTVGNLQGGLNAPVKAAVALYILWFGYQMAIGAIQAPVGEMIKRAVRVGSILMLVLGGSLYNEWIKVPFMTTIPNEISKMVVNGGGQWSDTSSAYDSIVNKATLSAQLMYDGSTGLTGGFAALFNGWVVKAVAYVAAVVGFFYSMYAKLALGLILGLGPVFIALAMFDATKRFFDGWLSQCANYIILQILFAAAQTVMLTLVTGMFGGDMGMANPGALAGAIVTCLVMMMLFWQLPFVAHALAAGGASMTMAALPGVQAARSAVSNYAGDKVAGIGQTAAARSGREKINRNKASAENGGPQEKLSGRERMATSLAEGSRGGFRDSRQYQHVHRSKEDRRKEQERRRPEADNINGNSNSAQERR